MTWAICFDLPNPDGHLSGRPCFGGAVSHLGNQVPAFFADLECAAHFATEDEAERFLASTFGPSVRGYGVVVELDDRQEQAA
jgi:hypothetical protein